MNDDNNTSTSTAQAYEGFTLLSTRFVASLKLEVQAYRHDATGALHYHLAADNDENVFMVALRTVPMDDRGVAHILEHTALCGSERYPVRDPFFMMLRRSLNTFMNAFTSSDWTAYPFASKNKKDFENLLGVYLDAVFFSRLDRLDFAQEGHRFAFSEPDDAESELVYQGVVFNEMKGAMSSPTSVLWHKVTKHLYPTVTYHYNSGGEPEAIPDLSYDDLQAFYGKHYHPSNAIFLTYGDISADCHQKKFNDLVLSRFERGDTNIAVGQEQRYSEPKQVQEHYACEDSDDNTYHVVSWLLGDVTDFRSVIEAHFVTGLLLDHSASPLQHALETSDLGTGPAPLSGVSAEQLQMSFSCGVEGSNPELAEQVEQLILATLEKVVSEGIDFEMCESTLRQIELNQREIGGAGYPYGLQLLLEALTPAVHRADPISFLDIDEVLADIRADIKNPDFVPGLIKRLLLDNSHRVLLTLSPDSNLAEQKIKAEAKKLADIKAKMNAEELQLVINNSKLLADRQVMEEDLSVLPNLTREDIPSGWSLARGERHNISGVEIDAYEQPCNGLCYQDIVVSLPEMPEWQMLPWFNECFTELGCGDADYTKMQERQYCESGGVGSSLTIYSDCHDSSLVRGYFGLSGKALISQGSDLTGLLADMLSSVRFDEPDRVKDVMLQLVARERRSITGQGHSLAMTAASSAHDAGACWSHNLFGLQGIAQLVALENNIDDMLPQLLAVFKEQHAVLMESSRSALLIAESELLAERLANMAAVLTESASVIKHNLPAVPDFSVADKQLWVTDSQVNFCAKAYPTVGLVHEDCAALKVLALVMRNGYCHRVIREQGGAYGGGAVQSGNCLRFYSYRDPRLTETLADFDRSVEWVLERNLAKSALEEAVLGIIGQLDKPSSPAGEARKAFYSDYEGRTEAIQKQLRDRVLAVTREDLYRVAEMYLQPEKASTAVVSHAQMLDKVGDLGMKVYHLTDDE